MSSCSSGEGYQVDLVRAREQNAVVVEAAEHVLHRIGQGADARGPAGQRHGIDRLPGKAVDAARAHAQVRAARGHVQVLRLGAREDAQGGRILLLAGEGEEHVQLVPGAGVAQRPAVDRDAGLRGVAGAAAVDGARADDVDGAAAHQRAVIELVRRGIPRHKELARLIDVEHGPLFLSTFLRMSWQNSEAQNILRV